MLTYLAIAERLKPRWLVWENVPGVLSSNGGKDFGSFLGALGELGYEWAYRVLDAQWFGVALVQEAVAVDCYNKTIGDKSQSISSSASDINHTGGVINPADRMAVRRLTPRECERLQGFDDDHTLIPWRGKPADQCPDGPRYKALGNSMAVPCMAWIGKRIAKAERERQGTS